MMRSDIFYSNTPAPDSKSWNNCHSSRLRGRQGIRHIYYPPNSPCDHSNRGQNRKRRLGGGHGIFYTCPIYRLDQPFCTAGYPHTLSIVSCSQSPSGNLFHHDCRRGRRGGNRRRPRLDCWTRSRADKHRHHKPSLHCNIRCHSCSVHHQDCTT